MGGKNQLERVFVDTNVIIEANRIGCWSAICSRFSVETVEKCFEEACTGKNGLDANRLRDELTAIHEVSEEEIAFFALSHSNIALDDGELHLLSWIKSQAAQGVFKILLSTADKAAVRGAHLINQLDSLVSLEALSKSSGVSSDQMKSIAMHYRSNWLSHLKTQILLGAYS